MHSIYRLYNIICSFHFIIAIAVLLAGSNGSFHYLKIIEINRINQTTISTISIVEADISLSAPYFIASVSACIFSIAYLSFFYSDTIESQRISQAILSSAYNNNSNLNNEDLQPEEISNFSSIILLSEMMYWGFVISSSYTAIASNTATLQTIDFLYLRLLVHLFSIYTICSQANSKRQIDLISSLAFMVFIGETFVDISLTGTQINIVMAYFHRFLDFLLLMGHRWDSAPSWEIILNCRLFYIAMGGLLLHFDIGLSTMQSKSISL
jgi:hypothetical protein